MDHTYVALPTSLCKAAPISWCLNMPALALFTHDHQLSALNQLALTALPSAQPACLKIHLSYLRHVHD